MKKRILFVNASLQLGGVERSLVDILKNINYDLYEVYLYLDDIEGGFSDEIPLGVRIITPNMTGLYGSYITILKKLLYNKKYQELYLRTIRLLGDKINGKMLMMLKPFYKKKYGVFDTVIGFREGFYTYFAMQVFCSKEYIGWWHGAVPPVSLKEYRGINKLSKLVGVSEGVAKMLGDIFPEMKKKIITIPNMVDNKKILSLCENDIKINTLEEHNIRIVTVCRLSPEKHLENIIECADKLREENIRFVWKIIGDGSEGEKIKKLINAKELSKCVVLEGAQYNPYPYLREADLYVHSSYIESQGLTILEAMTLGVPCVVTKTMGPCEFITSEKNGLLVEKSSEALAEGVMRMVKEPDLYQKIKANTYCPKEYLPKAVIQRIEKLF